MKNNSAATKLAVTTPLRQLLRTIRTKVVTVDGAEDLPTLEALMRAMKEDLVTVAVMGDRLCLTDKGDREAGP